MKFSSLFFAVLLECLAFNSQAAEIAVGADVAPLVAWADHCVLLFCNQNDQSGNSSGYGFHVGLWLPHDGMRKTGLELGYDKPGSTSGNTVYNLTPGCLILCQTATATWKHETTITHVAALGVVPLDQRNTYGALIAKIGLYSSSTNSWGNYGQGGGTYSRQISGAGLLLGAGYILPFAPHLSARAGADIFFSVKVADPVNAGNTMPETLVRLSLGVDYSF
jgi:hypothetical protein